MCGVFIVLQRFITSLNFMRSRSDASFTAAFSGYFASVILRKRSPAAIWFVNSDFITDL